VAKKMAAWSSYWYNPRPDEILVVGALVAEYLYERTCPILALPEDAHGAIATGDHVAVSGNGTVTVHPVPA
jgi:predicted aconitase with swiveling domain